jgi:hypothetical protein
MCHSVPIIDCFTSPACPCDSKSAPVSPLSVSFQGNKPVSDEDYQRAVKKLYGRWPQNAVVSRDEFLDWGEII